MTTTGAEAGNNPVPAGPVRPSDVIAAAGHIEVAADGALQPAVRDRRRLLRSMAAAVLAVLAALGAWQLLRHGVRIDAFPPFLADTEVTPITRYSGPWLTAAAGAALVAAMSLMFAVIDVVRWSRTRPQGDG